METYYDRFYHDITYFMCAFQVACPSLTRDQALQLVSKLCYPAKERKSAIYRAWRMALRDVKHDDNFPYCKLTRSIARKVGVKVTVP